MYKKRLLSILLFAGACSAFAVNAKDVQLDEQGQPCEDLVDLAETAQFHRLHFDCAKKKEARKTAEAKPQAAAQPVSEPVEPTAVNAAAPLATLTARASFDMTKAASLSNAQHALFRQMAQSCAHGWNTLAQGALPDSQPEHYQLSVQYQCLAL